MVTDVPRRFTVDAECATRESAQRSHLISLSPPPRDRRRTQRQLGMVVLNNNSAIDVDSSVASQRHAEQSLSIRTGGGNVSWNASSNEHRNCACLRRHRFLTNTITPQRMFRLAADTGSINQISGSIIATNLGVRASTDISLLSDRQQTLTFAAADDYR